MKVNINVKEYLALLKKVEEQRSIQCPQDHDPEGIRMFMESCVKEDLLLNEMDKVWESCSWSDKMIISVMSKL